MNKEEKEAIEHIKYLIEFTEDVCLYSTDNKSYKIVLNLIDKLQKTNRKYEYTITGMVQTREDNFIPKYKIREIVEKSYNDIDYFKRDIIKELEELLGE